MPLTLEIIRTLRPSGRTQRIFDGRGLYLEVSPRGSMWWRFRYRFEGREKRISLGVFPEIDIEQARSRREEAHALLEQGKDPSRERQRQRQALLGRTVGRASGLANDASDGAADASPSALGLRKFPLFAELSDQELAEVARQCSWKHYAPGEMVLQKGIEDHVILVISGSVKVSAIDSAGREVNFVNLAPGRHFGDSFALLDQPFALSAVASASSVVAKQDRRDFMRLIERHPAIQLRLLRQYAFVTMHLALRIIDLSTLSVPARLCSFLLPLAHMSGTDTKPGVRLAPAPTQQSLADSLGTSREQIARALAMLQRQGLVRREGRALLIPDTGALQRYLQTHGSDVSLSEQISYARLLDTFNAFPHDAGR